MRPHKLTISGFLSYGGCETVDFDQLATAGGLFLIHGSTGAGKTSILDAMAFALYGVLPGSRNSVQKSYRSDFAKPGTKTYVELELTLGDKYLKVFRSPPYEKPKERGEGTTTVKSEIKISQLVDGKWIPFSSTGQEAGSELQNLIGLDASQFFKLILLPQGDFAQFLRASAKERQGILEALFADEVALFKKISQYFKDQFNTASRKDANAEIALDTLVSNVATTFATLYGGSEADVDLDIPQNSTSTTAYLEALKHCASTIDAELAAADKMKKKALAAEQSAKTVFENSEKYLKAKKALEVASHDEATWRDENSIDIDGTTDAAKILKLLKKKLADAEKLLDSTVAANTKTEALIKSRDELASAADKLTEAEQALVTAQTDELTFKAEIEELEKTISDDVNPEADLERIKAEIEKQNNKLKDFKKFEKISQDIKKLQTELLTAVKDQEKSQTSLTELEHSYLAEQASVIAEQLKKGEPCPVCGSADHPQIAQDKGEVNQTTLKKAREKVVEAAGKVSAKSTEIAGKDEQLLEYADIQDLGIEQLQKELDELNSQQSQISRDLDSLVKSKKKLTDLRKSFVTAKELSGKSETLKATAEEKVKGLSEKVKEAEVALGIKAQAEIESVDLEPLESQIDHLSELSDEYEQLRNALTEARSAAEALSSDDDEELPDLKSAKEAREQAESELSALQSTFERVTKLKTALVKKEKEFANAEKSKAKSAEEVERFEKLSKHLNGETGARVPLVQYYFGHRLQQILVYANLRLQEMSHGQFSLQPNHKQGGRGQNYLSISVFDSWNQGLRDASSLSGGETFTASLALAFGLADVVTNEAGGKELESLFIDEGFGSLDPEYLQKVMESLYQLRESGRIIGLISHVEAMKQDIPMQLLVTKQNTTGTSVSIIENLVN